MSHRTSTTVFAAVVGLVFSVITLIWTIVYNLISGLVFATVLPLPPAVLGWFILSLVLYLVGKKRGDADLPALKSRLSVASGLLVFLLIVIAALVVFFAMAIMYM